MRWSLRRPKLALGVGLIIAAAAVFAAIPIVEAATNSTIVLARTPSVGCTGDPSLDFSANIHPSHSSKVMTLTWNVVNDEDSGFAGYWAMDTYTVSLTIWLLHDPPAGQLYYWVASFTSGSFIVPVGGVSPGETGSTPNAVSEPASGYGTLSGLEFGYIANTESFAPGTNPTSGSLGTLNYSGSMSDVLLGTYGNGQTGDANAFNWYTAYFSPGSAGDFSFGDGGNGWGFTYNLNSAFTGATSVNQWCDFGAGNYGDIVTQGGVAPPA